MKPPIDTTSATPGTWRSARSTTQSSCVRRSVGVWPSPRSRNRMISPTGVAFGATVSSAPAGRFTDDSRSATCWRTMFTFELSSYVITVNERPNCVCEKSRIEFGRPDSAVSSGSVTCFSTSSAARPGYSAMTVTCVSVTSGNASTDRFLNAITPAAANTSVARMMISGWCSA